MNKKFTTRSWITLICFIIYFLIGLSIISDFGIPTTEYYQYNYGKSVFNAYVPKSLKIPNESIDVIPFRHKYQHGGTYQALMVGINKIFNYKNLPPIELYIHHLITFILFCFAILSIYFICKELNFNFTQRLFAVLTLILQPRIFGEQFYNSSDIGALSLFTISHLTLLKFLKNRYQSKFLIIHIIASSFLIGGTKPFGIYIVGITITWYLYLSIKDKKIVTALKRSSAYLFLTLILSFFLFPTLWQTPLFEQIIKVFSFIKVYSWADPPLNILRWPLISTPIPILLCFGSSIILLSVFIIKRKIEITYLTIILSWAFLPIIIPLILNIGTYDGWRHHYFIWPAISILTSYVVIIIPKKYQCLIFIIFIIPLFDIITNHPFQGSYFNRIATGTITDPLYMDITTNSFIGYKQAIQKILKQSKNNKPIKILSPYPELKHNLAYFPSNIQRRITTIDNDDIVGRIYLPFNNSLKKFLKLYGNEREGALYFYNFDLKALEIRGTMLQFFHDKLLSYYSSPRVKHLISQYFKSKQHFIHRNGLIKMYQSNDYFIDIEEKKFTKISSILINNKEFIHIYQK